MVARIVCALTAVLLTAACAGAPMHETSRPTGISCTIKPGEHTLRHAGLNRRYLLALPARGRGPWPIVLNLHGLGSNAARQALRSRLPQAGAARGYAVVTPQVAPRRMAWTLPGYYGPDDTGYLTTLLDTLVAKGCAVKGQQFAAGMSYGGAMSAALVCGMNGRLAAVAPVAGFNVVPPCEEARPTTIIAFHGTGDQTVPYRGGHPFARSDSRLRTLARLVTLPAVESTARKWAAIMGCGAAVTSRVRPGVRLRAWRGCREEASVRLYTIGGAGHVWPRPGSGGRIDAAELILNAFDAVRKARSGRRGG
ncbi:alpha/beta hydrolase family esterase [Nonomuraea typhae]|uniref:alpha/beta hydrolase family esterase n=1 Tax=Nonomuraea typhae TaxID=2603600 RepID=UPI0012F91236|nr:hypothetical protein [Nonomuraea typhae]